MILTPTNLTTNPSEECPRADHALFYYKTCHYPPQVGTLGFEGISPLCPPLPDKAIKISFSTSSKALFPSFDSAPVYREAELSASQGHIYTTWGILKFAYKVLSSNQGIIFHFNSYIKNKKHFLRDQNSNK